MKIFVGLLTFAIAVNALAITNQIADSVAQAEDLSPFYECNIEIFQNEKPLTSKPVNLRTWIESNPGGGKIWPGTSSTCNADTTVVRNLEPRDVLIPDGKNAFLDFCYVMGDAIPPYGGAIRLGIVRRAANERSHKDYYKLKYLYVDPMREGETQFDLTVEDYRFKVSCGRVKME